MRRDNRMLIVSLWLALSITACLSPQAPAPQPTPEPVATARDLPRTVAPTRTASPTATPVPSRTPSPRPTLTPVFTATPSPTASTTPTITPSPTAPQPVTVALIRANANVRGGPGTDFPIIAAVRQDARLVVTGRSADASWLEVTLPEGKSGWIIAGVAQIEITALPPATSAPTDLPSDTAARPTLTPTATAAMSGDLRIEYLNPQYRCVQAEWRYRGDDGNLSSLWGYRSFAVTIFVQNNGVEPIVPPWGPRRWIITDGSVDSISDLTWGRADSGAEPSWQPTIKPGQYIGWSFSTFPIERNQWVKAMELIWQGHVYRLEFGPNTPGAAANYVDCGEPAPHTIRATPTPRPDAP